MEKPCALVVALRKLGGKWALLVLRELLDQPRRFGELKKPIPWISTHRSLGFWRGSNGKGSSNARLPRRDRCG
ncbi:MAG: helix-turn-helix transcriptional regulator, partial [Acidobacteria bacterium]|nr:helix-turn-helix transcriptional regulator [Acidobacteriota bacterium]